MFKRFIEGIVDAAGRYPYVALMAALMTMAATWAYSSRLQLRSDLMELLPRNSPGFRAFEHQLGRVGGGATILVIAESPDRSANERYVDALAARLEADIARQAGCARACADDACRSRCEPSLVSHIEAGTKDVRAYFENTKWLYADLADLEEADQTLDHQIALRSGLVEDLEGEPARPSSTPSGAAATARPAAATASAALTPLPDSKPALGMDAYRERWQAKAKKHDDFPTGYFATADGTMVGLRIISATGGMGDARGDRLLKSVDELTRSLNPASYHPQMKIGLAGDIPNAVAEKQSIVSEAVWAAALVLTVILASVAYFYSSISSLVVIAVPSLMGVGVAYAFATAAFGYVNTAGAFLGGIILGNGINYPIVLLSRYREFRARGQAPDEARREAVLNAFRAELVGASVASIAYGSLTVTQFRGFSQFGLIGFVGMLLVWVSIVPMVPALIVIVERLQPRFPRLLRDAPLRTDPDGSRAGFARFAAIATERHPWLFVTLGVLLTVFGAAKLPSYLRDPWEYNFDKLGSRGSKVGGAGEWSTKAEKVFGGKMNVAGAVMLADSPEQVPDVKARILANDAADPHGQLIADVATVEDFLPGSVPEQKEKLAVLDRIRERLTPAVLAGLSPEERQRIDDIRPPDTLEVVGAKDLPPLLRRRFEETNGVLGTVFYVKYKNHVSLSDGHNLLRIAKATDNVHLPDGKVVQTASRSTIFAEMIRSMQKDGPLATLTSFTMVLVVVVIATHSLRGAFAVILSLLMGVTWMLGGAALLDHKLNFLNFIALPVTFGIGCEYPFNIFDRSRLLNGDITAAVRRSGSAVALCSYTTIVGYGSLLVADNQALQSFGSLAVSGEIACLFAAMFFMPALLHLLKRRVPEPTRDTVALSE